MSSPDYLLYNMQQHTLLVSIILLLLLLLVDCQRTQRLPVPTTPLTTPGALIAESAKSKYLPVVESLVQLIQSKDPPFRPLLLRLAFHGLSTFDPRIIPIGGSNGGCVRGNPELGLKDNKGLDVATLALEVVKTSHPFITYADLYQLAGNVAIEFMGGPNIVWRPGRKDFSDADLPTLCVGDDERLPQKRRKDDNLPHEHTRNYLFKKFAEMGISTETDVDGFHKIVALMGAHTVGAMHKKVSGNEGNWTINVFHFDCEYFKNMANGPWGPSTATTRGTDLQYFGGPSPRFTVLPIDMILRADIRLMVVMREMEDDKKLFFKFFAEAWNQVQENGVDFGKGPVFTTQPIPDDIPRNKFRSSRELPRTPSPNTAPSSPRVFKPCPGSVPTSVAVTNISITLSYEFGTESDSGEEAIRFQVTNTGNNQFWGAAGFRTVTDNNNMLGIFPMAWDTTESEVFDMQKLNGFPTDVPSRSSPTIDIITESITTSRGSVSLVFWRLLETGNSNDIKLSEGDFNLALATGSGKLSTMERCTGRMSFPITLVGSCSTNTPTSVPTATPTSVPTAIPTSVPTAVPTGVPTATPTGVPTATPTGVPTAIPTGVPTAIPTGVPTAIPTGVPTATPTGVPTATPTGVPTAIPTGVPTAIPTGVPSAPVVTEVPTSSAVTNSPSVVTNSPSVVTNSPSAVTDSPLAVTNSPSAVTDSPLAVTNSPSAVTDSPLAVTNSPLAVTGSPSAVTNSPLTVGVTESPTVVRTDVPATTTTPAGATDSPIVVIAPPASASPVGTDSPTAVGTTVPAIGVTPTGTNSPTAVVRTNVPAAGGTTDSPTVAVRTNAPAISPSTPAGTDSPTVDATTSPTAAVSKSPSESPTSNTKVPTLDPNRPQRTLVPFTSIPESKSPTGDVTKSPDGKSPKPYTWPPLPGGGAPNSSGAPESVGVPTAEETVTENDDSWKPSYVTAAFIVGGILCGVLATIGAIKYRNSRDSLPLADFRIPDPDMETPRDDYYRYSQPYPPVRKHSI